MTVPVVVVGTIFVDLKCFPDQELNFKGRNLGLTRFFHGGVGRNVAETMGMLGSSVRFASSVQEGGVGHEVLSRLNESGVAIEGIQVTLQPDGHGMWGAIFHRDGDLACSISQMPNVSHMEGLGAAGTPDAGRDQAGRPRARSFGQPDGPGYA